MDFLKIKISLQERLDDNFKTKTRECDSCLTRNTRILKEEICFGRRGGEEFKQHVHTFQPQMPDVCETHRMVKQDEKEG